MARPYSPAQRALVGARNYNLYVRAEVQSSTGAWQDFGTLAGRSWFDSASWTDTVDQPVKDGKITFIREQDALSLAPLVSRAGNTVNNPGGVYVPALEGARGVRISVAYTAPGVAPVAGDYVEVFLGILSTPDWGGRDSNAIALVMRDIGQLLVSHWTHIEKVYGSAAGTPLEQCIQNVLDDNIEAKLGAFSTATNGIAANGAVTLYAPVASGVMVNAFTFPVGPVLTGLRDLASQFGWDVRFRYDAAGNFRLTLFNPPRGAPASIDSFGPGEYTEIPRLEIPDDDVRNNLDVYYTDAVSGQQAFVNLPNAVSIAKYGERYHRITLGSGSPVNTLTLAQQLASVVDSDLSLPYITQDMETNLLWFVQLGDAYTFLSNVVLYDTAQTLAVIGYTHTLEKGDGSTTLNCRAQAAGLYKNWLTLGGGAGTDLTIVPALYNFRYTETDTTRTYTWVRWQNTGYVFVYDKTVPQGQDGFPAVGSAPTIILKSGVDSYTVKKPPQGQQTFLQFEPRDDVRGAGDVRRVVVNPVPSALSGQIKALRTNGVADLTVTIDGAASNWPVLVQVYEGDPATAPIYVTTVSAPTTINKLSTGAAALGGRAIPLRELRSWFMVLTDVAGLTDKSETEADRDPLASGTVIVDDYQPTPKFTVTYDTDTDQVRITTPSGATKSFAVAGGGTVAYTIGDSLDDTSIENALLRGTTHGPYTVDVLGGGVYRTIWTGNIHGAVAAGPSLDVHAVHGATTSAIFWTAPLGTVQLSIDSGVYATAPTSPITATRPAAGQPADNYAFRLTLNEQTVTDGVDVPAIDQDTATPDLAVAPGVSTDTTVTFTPSATNPKPGGAVPTIDVTLKGVTATIGGVAKADGTTTTVASGTVVVVDRPTFGGTNTANQPTVIFHAAIAGAGGETIARTILPQVKVTFGPSLDMTANQGATSTAISYVASGGTVQLSINNGAYTTAPASPITVTRPAAGSTPLVYALRVTADGQTASASETIIPIDADTATPTLTVQPSNPTDTQQTFFASTTNPKAGGPAPVLTVSLRGCTATIPGVATLAAGSTTTISSGTTVVVDRPAFGTAAQASIEFNATISGGGAADYQRTVLTQVKTSFGPSLTVTTTPGSLSVSITYSGIYDTILLSIDGGTYGTPPASPFTVSRTSTDHTYAFKATKDGQDTPGSAFVPALVGTGGPSFSSVAISVSNYASDQMSFAWTPVNAPAGATFNVIYYEQSAVANPNLGNTTTAVNVTSPFLWTANNDIDPAGTRTKRFTAYVVMISGATVVATSATDQITVQSLT